MRSGALFSLPKNETEGPCGCMRRKSYAITRPHGRKVLTEQK
jgi:hypothetical protein